MSLTTKLVVGGVVAGTALAYYVRRRHTRTGESYVHILTHLPTLARNTVDDVRQRALVAVDEGKAAARAREEAFTRQLEAATPPSSGGASSTSW